MAKNHKWEGDVLVYNVPGAGDAKIDISQLSEAVKHAALMFGVQTAARNSTAGLFTEDPALALKRMTGRFVTWLAGEWKAASAGGEGAERPTSMLAMAVAEGGGITAEEAAAAIAGVIEEKITDAGLSADEDGDKPAIRKIAAAVRALFAEMPEVKGPLARIRAEAALRRQAETDAELAKAKAEGKASGSLSDLLKK